VRASALALALIAGPALGADPFPMPPGTPFALHTGAGVPRTEVDPAGNHQILYFGYANCPDMCLTTLPHIAAVVEALAAIGIAVTPLMITVDPGHDQGPAMDATLAAHHPAFVGLTGPEAALRPIWQAFGITFEEMFLDPYGQPILAHTGHLFLLGPQGNLETLLPPVLPVEATARIIARYAGVAG
jgi:protein SCO1